MTEIVEVPLELVRLRLGYRDSGDSMGRKRHYPGHIEQRGDAYRLILTVAGKRHKFTLRGMSRGAVERFASRTYDELLTQAELRPTGV